MDDLKLVHVYREGNDDPEKCSALMLERHGLIELHTRKSRLPSGVVLDPFAEKALSPQDGQPIIAIDASWRDAEHRFTDIEGDHRALPFLIATNPVSYGKPYRLNTAEAVTAALFILGYRDEAQAISEKIDYIKQFIEMNREPLERYSDADDSEEVVEIQSDYLG